VVETCLWLFRLLQWTRFASSFRIMAHEWNIQCRADILCFPNLYFGHQRIRRGHPVDLVPLFPSPSLSSLPIYFPLSPLSYNSSALFLPVESTIPTPHFTPQSPSQSRPSHSPTPPHHLQMPQHTHIRIQKPIHTILRARLLPTRQRTPRDFITRHAFRPANVGEVVNGCRTRALATPPSKHRAAEGESRKGLRERRRSCREAIHSWILAFCISFFSDCWRSRFSASERLSIWDCETDGESMVSSRAENRGKKEGRRENFEAECL